MDVSMADILKIYIRRAKAKSQFNVFLAVLFIVPGLALLLPVVLIMQNGQQAWGEALLSLFFVGLPASLLYPVVRRYGKLKEFNDPIFTLTKDGIIHDFLEKESLLRWQDIKCVKWGASNLMSQGRVFTVVCRKRSFVGTLLGIIGIHSFQYAEVDLSLTSEGAAYYASKSIDRFLKKHAPAEIIK